MKDPELLWFDIVNRISKQSKCQSRQVGAILVDNNGHMFGQGFNGAPSGSFCSDCPRCLSLNQDHQSGKDLHLAICAHAEANAIAVAAKSGRSTNQSILYCTTKPCAECAKLIVGAGIVEVIYNENYNSPLTDIIFKNASIKIRKNIHATHQF